MSGFRLRRVMPVLSILVVGAALRVPAATDLLELHARATEYDPQYQAARVQQEIVRQDLNVAKSGILPTIAASADASKTYQDVTSSETDVFTTGRSDFFSDLYTISLTQPVYSAVTRTRLPQARAEVRQIDLQFAAAEQDLMLRVAEAHLGYLAARDGLDLARAERTAIERQLQESEQRLSAGLGTIGDVHDARGRFALAQAEELDALDALEDSRQQVAEITGAPPVELKALSESFPLVEPDQPDVEVWVETALFQNPRIKALQAALDAADQGIRLQRAGRAPTLDLVAAYSFSDRGGTEFGGGSEIETTDLTLRLSIPVYDGGRTAANARRATLERAVVTQRGERVRRQVERETRSAFQGVVSGITRVRALQQSVFSHEAALAQKQEGLRAGLATGLEVLDARRELFAARRDLAEARYRYIVDGLRLKLATGILSTDDLKQVNAYLQ